MSVTYSIPLGSLIEVQLVGTLHGQRTRNVFHYTLGGTASTDGESALEALGQVFDSAVGIAIRAMQSSEHLHDYVVAQMIKATRYRPVPVTLGSPGDLQFGSLPSGVAAVISRNAITAGRRYQCRNYIPGIASSLEADSKLTPAGINSLGLIGDATSVTLLVNGGQQQFIPITSGNVTTPVPLAYYVQQHFPRSELHYQRRRAVGHGE